MKDRYMIGEVAELLNMSPQSLRFYDKVGVVVPAYTDPKTGYRYYSYDQIHYIDRIKYLQRFGFKLEDIRDALAANDVSQFRKLLVQRQDTIRKEVSHLQGLLDELDWYVDYYGHVDDHDYNGLPYQQRETERYILAEPFRPGENAYGTAGQRLTKLRHSPQFDGAQFLRHTGYLLDFQALLRGEIVPTHYFVYLKELPPVEHPKLKKLPAGNWLCVQSRILAEPFPGSEISRYFRDKTSPRLVAANEYEDNFRSFRNCIYEVQIFQHN